MQQVKEAKEAKLCTCDRVRAKPFEQHLFRGLHCYPSMHPQVQGAAWHFAPPSGESQWQVEQRMLACLTELVLPALAPGELAIVVGHGE